MTTETKYPYSKASKAASYIAELLRPHCTRLHIAGSIRRLRPEVKDIEIVCQPKKELKQSGLFPDYTQSITDRNFTEALAIITDIIILGNVEGRYMQIRTNSKICHGIKLDIFMPQPDDYYRIYAIRTGSVDYARHTIAAAWVKKGWVGTSNGLRLKKESIEKVGGWVCEKHPTLPPVWSNEGEFFTWLGLPYTDPEYRNYKPLNEQQ